MAYTDRTLKDGAGANFTAPVWTPGRDAAASSQPVALSTEDKAALDGIGDKMPALALTRTVLLNAVTTAQASAAFADTGKLPTVSLSLRGTGALTASYRFEGRVGSADEWALLASETTMSGTTAVGDACTSLVRYGEYRVVLVSITGTGAAFTAAIGA